jgi:hypothetical protein
MLCSITDALPFSLPFPLSPSSIEYSTVTNMFYIWVCICSCLFFCICLSLDLSFTYERKHYGFCVSDPGLLHIFTLHWKTGSRFLSCLRT